MEDSLLKRKSGQETEEVEAKRSRTDTGEFEASTDAGDGGEASDGQGGSQGSKTHVLHVAGLDRKLWVDGTKKLLRRAGVEGA